MFETTAKWMGSALMAAVILAGCGASRPDWVMKGSGAFKKDQKVLYGVGIAEGIRSEALRRTTADNRALAEISKQMSAISTSLMRDYMASTSVPPEQKSNEEQYVENTIKTFTSNVVSGVKVIDRFEDKKGTLYSLATLNLDDLKTLAGEAKELSEAVREHIKANAEKAFDKLAEEEAKQSQR
ncbi:MAG: LPP20 family lipoprotein [Elusimicrobia bacterium]|nr:LPP20 family lipoprotein [Elusimicrobiota bacterium]